MRAKTGKSGKVIKTRCRSYKNDGHVKQESTPEENCALTRQSMLPNSEIDTDKICTDGRRWAYIEIYLGSIIGSGNKLILAKAYLSSCSCSSDPVVGYEISFTIGRI